MLQAIAFPFILTFSPPAGRNVDGISYFDILGLSPTFTGIHHYFL
jgi:hypothetical protein